MMTDAPEPLPRRPADLAPFRAGSWLVEPSLNRAERDGEQVSLQPRIMHVLVCLAARAGRVVSRDELLDTVWQDAVVCEDALTRTISELRRTFADDPQAPTFIETIRKGGYRLLAPVTPVAAAPSGEPSVEQAVPAAPPSPSPRTRSRRRGLFTLALVLAAVVVAVLVLRTQGAHTAAPGPPRLLATQPFTSYPGSERDPALSPDGTRVAFVWDGGEGVNYDLYVKQRDTETPLRLTESEDNERYPAWSPDGSTIAFAGKRDGRCGIFTVPAIGGPEQRLTYAEAPITGIDWSPDGRRLVYTFTYHEGHQPCLMLFDPATGEHRPLTDPLPPNMCDHKPAFSPDGTRVAFLRYGGRFDEDIHLVPSEGGEVTALTERQRWVTGFDWTPDGTALVFGAAPDGRYRLWSVPAAGGPVTRLATPGEMAFTPSLALHAAGMVYEQLTCDCDIWALRDHGPDGPAPEASPLISSTRMDHSPHLSPDGRSITFVSTRSGSREIWVCEADGSGPRQLTSFGDRFVSHPRWSPDGRAIAFTANPDRATAVHLVDAATCEVRQLGDTAQGAMFCDWSPDGRFIYFVSDRSGEDQVWRMAPDGSAPEQVTRHGGLHARVSHDGRAVWYCKWGQTGLWRTDFETGEERCVLETPENERWVSWELGDGAVYYVMSATDHYRLTRRDLATGEARTLVKLPPLTAPTIAVSPDGRTILFEHPDRVERDLVFTANLQ